MAAPLARMMPPGDGKHGTITVHGRRTYTCPVGASSDVPTFDAHLLSANGWTRFGGPTCFVGATSARPATAPGNQPIAQDQPFFDTTLNQLVTWDRLSMVWRGPTGAAA